jgi:hypothetical protein
MLERNRWHVHPDVGAAVDAMLAGQHPGGQARERAADGSILRYNYNPSIPNAGPRGGPAAAARSALPELAAAAAPRGGERVGAARASLDGGDGSPLLRPAMPSGGGGAAGGGAVTGNSFVRRGLFNGPRDEGPVTGGCITCSLALRFHFPLSFCTFQSPALLRTPSPPTPTQNPAPPGAMVTRRGRHVRLGTASPQEALLRLYCVDLDEERVWEVMTAMALHDKVWGGGG